MKWVKEDYLSVPFSVQSGMLTLYINHVNIQWTAYIGKRKNSHKMSIATLEGVVEQGQIIWV